MAPSHDALSFATLFHMVTTKLSSSKYLLWNTQIVSVLACQNYLGFVDGRKYASPSTVRDATGKKGPNPDFEALSATDQLV
ncbi:hypothetical protein ACS0TY_028165 [Phlomoides rotata]